MNVMGENVAVSRFYRCSRQGMGAHVGPVASGMEPTKPSVAPEAFLGTQWGQVCFSTVSSPLSSRDQLGARGQPHNLSVNVLHTCKVFPGMNQRPE